MFKNCRPYLFLSLILIATSGCASWDQLRGENFTDREARWGESMRSAGPEGELWGFSEKARQIERNVGVR